MKKRLIVLSSVLSLTPIWALAANATCSSNLLTPIEGVICTIGKILNTVIPVLIVLGVLYFVWGVVAYVIGNDEEAKKKGRNRIIYGIIGLVVIVGMWGLVNLVTSTFGLSNTGVPITTPCVPGTPGC
jgi:uncharacterized membrane protein (GlpM family)